MNQGCGVRMLIDSPPGHARGLVQQIAVVEDAYGPVGKNPGIMLTPEWLRSRIAEHGEALRRMGAA